MKKSFQLIAIFFLIVCLNAGHPTQAFGQVKRSPLPKDSLSTKVMKGTSEVPLGVAASLSQANTLAMNEGATHSIQTQSALTGPGKVVMCVAVLSCLFFYHNRKK